MKSFLKYFLLLVPFLGSSQKILIVTFKQAVHYKNIESKAEKMEVLKWKLCFNDSEALSYGYREIKDPFFKRIKRNENYLLHHSSYYSTKTNLRYDVVNFKGKYLIVDTARNWNWQLLDKSKEFIGFQCKAALSINSKGDSTYVWYTKEIPLPFGPSVYSGLPGVILEIFDQRYGFHYYATKVVVDSFKISIPENVQQISKEEFWKLKR